MNGFTFFRKKNGESAGPKDFLDVASLEECFKRELGYTQHALAHETIRIGVSLKELKETLDKNDEEFMALLSKFDVALGELDSKQEKMGLYSTLIFLTALLGVVLSVIGLWH